MKNGITISCGCAQRRAITNLGRIRFDDLSGQRFSRLLVIERSVDGKDGKPMFLCRCDCGNKSIVKSQNLRGGTTTSCGCYVREISAARLVKHGLSRTPEYLRQKRARRYRRRRNDPLELSKMRIRDLIRKSIAAKGFRKNCPTHEILGCSYDELRSHIERQFSKGMSWERIGEIHIDHIIPMASANSIEDVYRLNHHTNLRPMWSKDNIKKGASREFLI